MNKNYERGSRRKLLTTGCFRKWLKPMECKHLQRTIENKRDLTETEIVNCVFLTERKAPQNGNKFVKFWKNKLFISSSVRSLHRYFTNKVRSTDIVRNLNVNKINTDNEVITVLKDHKKEVVSLKDNEKCNLLDGHLVLRGHEKHCSAESCAIYCQLSNHGWYWGGISSSEAEELLAGQHDNVFLVRDSFSSRHLLCVSFRCVGRTLHARLRHANGLFSLNNETFVPASRLSEHCATVDVQIDHFERPMRLARPLNRFAKLDTLQMICRFVIRQTFATDTYCKLPLPTNLISYVSLGSDYVPPHS